MKKIAYLLFILTAFSACKDNKRTLPFYGARTPVEHIVDGKLVIDTVYQTIPPFSFINQDSAIVNENMFKNKVYVADFFFTSCPSICPIMHRNMMKVYLKYRGNKDVKLLSHSIDYKYDLPYVLKRYATKLGVNGSQWQFVRGPRDSIYSLAQKNYLVAVNEDKKAPGGYAHQGYLVLVDTKGRVRGAYDGTKSEEVAKLMEDMDVLLDPQN